MKNYLKLISLAMVSLFFLGCATVHLSTGEIELPVSMSYNVNKEFLIIKHFKRDMKSYFAIFSLVTVKNPNVKDIIREELMAAQGDAVINTKIKGHTKIEDIAVQYGLGVIGALIYYPWGAYAQWLIAARTYTIEGDVIRYLE